MIRWLLAAALGAGGGPAISVFDVALHAISNTASNAVATIQFSSAGHVAESASPQGTETPNTPWLLKGSAGDYDVRVDVTGDTASMSGAAINSWQNLATSKSFTITDTTSVAGGKSVTGTWSISLAGQATALATASFSLSADRDSV